MLCSHNNPQGGYVKFSLLFSSLLFSSLLFLFLLIILIFFQEDTKIKNKKKMIVSNLYSLREHWRILSPPLSPIPLTLTLDFVGDAICACQMPTEYIFSIKYVKK